MKTEDRNTNQRIDLDLFSVDDITPISLSFFYPHMKKKFFLEISRESRLFYF